MCNICSEFYHSCYAGYHIYSTLKQVRSDGIRVTNINPGPVESEIGDHAIRDPSLPKMQV